MALPPTNFVPLAAHSSCFAFSWELWLLIVLYRTHRSPNRVALYGCLPKEFWCDQSLYCISEAKHSKYQQAKVIFLKILWEEWKRKEFFVLFCFPVQHSEKCINESLLGNLIRYSVQSVPSCLSVADLLPSDCTLSHNFIPGIGGSLFLFLEKSFLIQQDSLRSKTQLLQIIALIYFILLDL